LRGLHNKLNMFLSHPEVFENSNVYISVYKLFFNFS